MDSFRAVNKDAAFIQSVLSSSQIRSIMEHPGWESVIAIITRLMHGSQNKAEQTLRDPSFDTLIKGTHYNGQVSFAKTLLHTLSSMYDRAGVVLKDAQKKLPRAPVKGKRDKSDPVLSEPDTRKEDTDERREKPAKVRQRPGKGKAGTGRRKRKAASGKV